MYIGRRLHSKKEIGTCDRYKNFMIYSMKLQTKTLEEDQVVIQFIFKSFQESFWQQ